MPASHGWRREVVFGGRKSILMFVSWMSGWAPQLSTNSKMCRPCRCILLFSLSNHSLNKEEVIQAFLFARYVIGRAALSIPRKQRGFSDFPMTSGFSLSPAAEQANSTVTLSLEVLIPFRGSPRITVDRSGRAR